MHGHNIAPYNTLVNTKAISILYSKDAFLEIGYLKNAFICKKRSPAPARLPIKVTNSLGYKTVTSSKTYAALASVPSFLLKTNSSPTLSTRITSPG